MNTKIHSNRIVFLITLVAAVSVVFLTSAFRARAATIFDITFPIAELGGCADKNSCKAYCADDANHDACAQFAADHGISPPSSQRDEKLDAVQKDGGPGNCAAGAKDPHASCKAYCNSTDHINTCVAYGKSHGFLVGKQLAEAEKVAAALKNGAKLPEGCTDQDSCKAVCEDPSTVAQAKSCFAFGKAAGLLPPDFNEERAGKVFQAIQDGTAPFKSVKDFRQCENPQDDSTLQKCVDFGVKSGMLDETQAAVIKKTGGKGPGGCMGEACRAYCEDHQQECFQFSKENGLVTPEQEQQMKQGVEQFKQNLDRAPTAIKACLASAIGQEALDAITSGATMPDRTLGEKMRTCFEQNRPTGDEGGGHSPDKDLQQGPPQDGEGMYRQSDSPQSSRSQFMDFSSGMSASSSGKRIYENRRGDERGRTQNQQQAQDIPPQVKECLAQKYGNDVSQRFSQGPAQGELANAIRDCYRNAFGEAASLKREQEQRSRPEGNQHDNQRLPDSRPPAGNNETERPDYFQQPPMMMSPQPVQMPPQGVNEFVRPFGNVSIPPQNDTINQQ